MTDEAPPGQVFRLSDELITPPEPVKPTPPGRLHGWAIFGMAACALLGTLALFAFITVGWPETTGRYVVTAFIGCIVGFITCASIAVFSAARDTYPHDRTEE